ncbi:MAG: hypothetical protein IT371_29615 [Deltaproteobacteria bacterium]|nr:hypothetical protein [Deltaproteobacteria bacterium]
MKRALLWIVAGMGLAACGPREHLREDYGRQTRQFWTRQKINREAATGNPLGLDSEEAVLIQGRYRKTIGGSEATGEVGKGSPARVLLLQEGKDGKGGK